MRYAVQEDMITHNPANELGGTLITPKIIAFDTVANRAIAIRPKPIIDQIIQTTVIIYKPLFYYYRKFKTNLFTAHLDR